MLRVIRHDRGVRSSNERVVGGLSSKTDAAIHGIECLSHCSSVPIVQKKLASQEQRYAMPAMRIDGSVARTQSCFASCIDAC